MEFRFRIEEREGYLLALPKGDAPSTEQWCAAAEEMFLYAIGRNASRLLINRQQTPLEVETLDAVQVAEFLDSLDFQQQGLRIAVLVKPTNVKPFSMLETTMTNRSFTYKVFQDEEKLMQWLMGE